MLKNLHLKIFSLVLAILFWIFIVSIENNFAELPNPIPVNVFNLASDLAIASKLGEVKLTVRAADQVTLRKLLPSDFEAYIDLRNVGVGQKYVPVSVSSRNPQVSVLRSDPREISVIIEPIREKSLAISEEVIGLPKSGFSIKNTKLSRERVSVKGAESVLQNLSYAKAAVILDGSESGTVTKDVTVKIYDSDGVLVEGLMIDGGQINANITFEESMKTKRVEVLAALAERPGTDGLKKVTNTPAFVSIVGPENLLKNINDIKTEEINYVGVNENFSRRVKLIFPEGVSLAPGESGEVTVDVELDLKVSTDPPLAPATPEIPPVVQ